MSAPEPTVPASPPTLDLQRTHTNAGSQAAAGAAPPVALPGYVIEHVLGRGGMGIVYKATHLALRREVALKMVLDPRTVDAAGLERFKAEAQAVARLQHPNIVQIFEVGEVEGRPWCALEYVAGGSLAQRLAQGPLPGAEAAQLVQTLARAMQAAHARGIVHRDLKPANVLLVSGGVVSGEWSTDSSPTTHHSPLTTYQPKIADFGLAKRLDDDSGQTQAGAILGTPSYMAPEQAAGHTADVGPAADVYALGAILYECLTGRPPFRAATMLQTLDQVRQQEPVPPRTLQPTVPRDLDTITLKCLQKDPARRYASAEALADDLGRFLRHEPIIARPVGAVERAVKLVKRRPLAVALAAALGVALVAGTAVSGYFAYEAGLRADEAEDNANRANTNAAAAKTQALRAEKGERAATEKTDLAEKREREAKDLAAQLVEEAKKTAAANDEVEKVLVARLLAPLGSGDKSWEKAEFANLTDIAALPSDSVRLRLMAELVTQPALQKRLLADKSAQRLPVVLHAVLGIDPTRRARSAQYALALLKKDPRPVENAALRELTRQLLADEPALLLAVVDHNVLGRFLLTPSALAVAALPGPEAERRAGPLAGELVNLATNSDPYSRQSAFAALAKLAPRLSEAEARPLAAQLMAIRAKLTGPKEGPSFGKNLSAEPLQALLARLPAAEASALARQFLLDQADQDPLRWLWWGAPVYASLTGADAEAVADVLLGHIAPAKHAGKQFGALLAETVGEHLLPRLAPPMKYKLAEAAALMLLPGPADWKQFDNLTSRGPKALAKVFPHLLPATALKLTEEAARLLGQLQGFAEQHYRTLCLTAQLESLPKDQAPAVARPVAETALKLLRGQANNNTRAEALNLLKAAAALLPAADAQALAEALAQDPKGSWTAREYAAAFTFLVAPVAPPALEAAVRKVADDLQGAIEREPETVWPETSRQALGHLLDRLPADEARTRALQSLQHGVDKNKLSPPPFIIRHLAGFLSAEQKLQLHARIVERLGRAASQEEANVCLTYLIYLHDCLPAEKKPAAATSAWAVLRTKLSGKRSTWVDARILRTVARWQSDIPHADLHPFAEKLSQRLHAELVEGQFKDVATHMDAMLAVGELLPPAQAREAGLAMIATYTTLSAGGGQVPVQVTKPLLAIAKSLPPEIALALARRVQEMYLQTPNTQDRPPYLTLHRELLGRLDREQLVELLAMPTAVEAPFSVSLLQTLEQKCGRPFASIGEFAQWSKAPKGGG
jgi:hypothetical protein